MQIDLEEAHTELNNMEELINEGKFREARKYIGKFIGIMETMDARLKVLRDVK